MQLANNPPVDQDIQSTQLVYGFLDGALHVLFVCQIRHNRHSMFEFVCLVSTQVLKKQAPG